MALLGTEVLTLADLTKRLGADGKVETAMIETMNTTNEVLDDMMFKEANGGVVHKTVVRTGLPSVAWRMLNYGVPKSKSTSATVQDTVGMLEAYSEVDKDLADMSGNTAAFRMSEASAFLESMSQAAATTVFYGNSEINPERFTGLSVRYNTVNTATAKTAENVVDAGGVGATNTSVWLIVWGDRSVHGIFPKGSRAGLQRNDKGQQTLQDANGNNFEGYRDHFKWNLGLSVRDWRYVVRIANIDVALARTDANYLKALIGFMIDAEERVYALPGGVSGEGRPRAAWYGNRTIRTLLRKAKLEKIANNLTEETIAGRVFTGFDGIPFRMTDALINTEARVV